MGFGIHINVNLNPVGRWIGNAVKTAGRPVGQVAHAIQGVEGAVGKEIAKVPIVGKPLHAAFDLAFMASYGPMLLVGDVIGGDRIDHAVLDRLKNELQDVKDVAPYVQTVIALVPGVGPGVSGAISAGLALAEGQSWTVVMEDAVAGAIPGGALAKAVFDASKTAIQIAQHKGHITWGDIVQIGSAASEVVGGLPDGVKDSIVGALGPAAQAVQGVTGTVAQVKATIGPIVSQADTAFSALKTALPPEALKAMQVGIAVGHAKLVQSTSLPALSDPGLKNRLMAQGQQVATSDPTVQAARSTIHAGYNGFDAGVGMMRMTITPHQFQIFRGTLSGPDLTGFDLAASLHVGRVASPPVAGSAQASAGYAATLGMQGAPAASKTDIMAGIVSKSVVASGAKAALGQVAKQRASWWERLIAFFTGKEHILA